MPLMKTRPVRKNMDRISCNYRKLSIVSTSLLLLNFGLGRDETRHDIVSSLELMSRSRLVMGRTKLGLVSSRNSRRDETEKSLVSCETLFCAGGGQKNCINCGLNGLRRVTRHSNNNNNKLYCNTDIYKKNGGNFKNTWL